LTFLQSINLAAGKLELAGKAPSDAAFDARGGQVYYVFVGGIHGKY
jgi:hypothetical protein